MILNQWEHESRQICSDDGLAPCICGGGSSHCHGQHYVMTNNGRNFVMEDEYIVRRLTPTECARLQGFPDDWCADVPHSDSAEYKLWGNGIALNTLIEPLKNIKRILSEEG